MAFEKCSKCGGLHWSTDACKKSGEGERIGAQAVHGFSGGDAVQLGVSAVSNKPSLDTHPAPAANKSGRAIPQDRVESSDKPAARPDTIPKPRKNRNEYHRVNMIKWRAKKRAEKAAMVNAQATQTNG